MTARAKADRQVHAWTLMANRYLIPPARASVLRVNLMWNRVKVLVWVAVLATFASCTGRVLFHDEKSAAKSAEEFAKTTFVRRDYDRAFGMLPQTFQVKYGRDGFEKLVREMHFDAFPTEVASTEYEPIPGSNSITIFLVGERTGQKFYYRLLMSGSALTGYKIEGFFRRTIEYPQSKLRRKL